MNLHADNYPYNGKDGAGAPLLLIHGWGMHGGIWNGVAKKLARHFEVLAVDLPGHGKSSALEYYDLDILVDKLSARFIEPINVCGWSLGGQIALRWAQRCPQQVRRLILVASTPCFAQREDWHHAMPLETLIEFAHALQQHYALTLKRFLALQLRGSEQGREILPALRAALFSRGEPALQGLQDGLAILRDCDLRSTLSSIMQRTLIVAGQADALVPLAASNYMAQQMPDATLITVKGAAHVPFLSHPDEFAEHLLKFLHG